MPDISISNQIHTPEGHVLFPAGSTVHEDALSEAIKARGRRHTDLVALSEFGTFHADTINFLNNDPYRHIFSKPDRVKKVLREMARVELPVQVLETLSLFRELDFYTYRHFCMVFALSALVSQDLEPEKGDSCSLSSTGPTHDIGKICVPVSILQKQSPLTHEEKRILSEHSVAGYVLLRYFSQGTHTLGAKVALEHHERRDCSGFPRGIRLADPMVEVIAVCDIYDALISPRPYRKTPYDNRTALEELCIMAEAGSLGWETVKLLIAYNRRSSPDYRDVSVSSEKRGTPPEENNYGVFSD